ncbi:hypothetical protein M9194_20070 [Vibrio sp. S4M6]|uniref:hypothetical protein n=1 Tax=Vibrio sinus TaxID=2946865 RepID=UPI00202A3296|nr:hypothetical protein [Vibrio sinus]MCL9783725.1 hypothetical protein [Vibrio sinus]
MNHPSIWQKLQSCERIIVESCSGRQAVLDIQGSLSKALDCHHGICIGINIIWSKQANMDVNRTNLLLTSSDETLDFALLPHADNWFLWQRYSKEPTSSEFNRKLTLHCALVKYVSSGFNNKSLENNDNLLEVMSFA